MAVPAAVHDALTRAGFARVELEDSPPELTWYHRRPSWRERIPVVAGFQRTVVVVDVPVARRERLHELTAHLAGVAALGEPQRAAERGAEPDPWWAKMIAGAVLLLAIALAMLTGLSIESEDRRWCLALFPRAGLSAEARRALQDALFTGEDLDGFAAALEPAPPGLELPDEGRPPWRANPASRRSLRDARAALGEHLRCRTLPREEEGATGA